MCRWLHKNKPKVHSHSSSAELLNLDWTFYDVHQNEIMGTFKTHELQKYNRCILLITDVRITDFISLKLHK